jgi:hypothetical protein
MYVCMLALPLDGAMNLELTIAALGWLVLAFGHTVIGAWWVLPDLKETRLPGTPFGPPSLTLNMLRFTWHIVSIVLVAFGVLFLILAWDPSADPRMLILRWAAAFLLGATALAVWQIRRRPRAVLRLPVPLVFLAIAAMCLAAST